jgi:hypothetical protein
METEFLDPAAHLVAVDAGKLHGVGLISVCALEGL